MILRPVGAFSVILLVILLVVVFDAMNRSTSSNTPGQDGAIPESLALRLLLMFDLPAGAASEKV